MIAGETYGKYHGAGEREMETCNNLARAVWIEARPGRVMSQPPSHGTLTPEDFRRIRDVFESALELSPAERVPFVEQACGGNTLLIAEVGRMLAADAADNTLLDDRAPAGDRFRAGAIFAGHYKFAGLIGRGGMGEVYRGSDTNLNRDVALKILPAAFALDGDRLARFKREAQVLASLNHPNIGAIYSDT